MPEKVRSWKEMPGPDGLPLVGQLFRFAKDPLRVFVELRELYGDYVRLRLGPYDYVLINDPVAIRTVLVQRHEQFVKSKNYIGLKLLLEDGLITSEGLVWKRKRKLVQPSVHPHKLAGFSDIVSKCADDMISVWSEQYGGGDLVDVHEEMMRLTFRVIGFIVMGKDMQGESMLMGEALDYLLDFANHYTNSLLRFVPLWLPLRSFREMRKYTSQVDSILLPIIEERRRLRGSGASGHDDLLERLLEAREDDEAPLTDLELKAELMTMVAAGHETTANALTWTLYLLSQHPDIADLLYAEVDHFFAQGAMTYERLKELTYTECVLRESMRIYPPVWVVERDCLDDVVLGDYLVPKGTTIAIAPWTLHRHPDFWDKPLEFRPERFAEDASQERPRHVYLPFGSGPRVCVGAALAMMEAKLILALMVRDVRFSLDPHHQLRFDPSITLRPKWGMKMKVEQRVSSGI